MNYPKKIIEQISKWDKIAIFHHKGIDGDSLSCSYGLLLAIKEKFPNKKVVWVADTDDINKNFSWFKYDTNLITNQIDNSYLAIIGDTASKTKLAFLETYNKAGYKIVFDHHQNDIEIAHDIFWSEPSMPASAIQAIEIVQELQVNIKEEIAFALMIGLLTDTGFFKYSLNDVRPVVKYSMLLEKISKEKMNYFWNQMGRKTKRDIEIQNYFFNNIKFSGSVAYVYFDYKKAQEFSDINFKLKINSIGNIENYPIWALFIEDIDDDDKKILKLHFRSNGPNVSSVAMKHQGGGHIRAAGAKIKLEKDSLNNILLELNSLI